MPSLQRALYGATRGIVSRRARYELKAPAPHSADMWRLILLMGGLACGAQQIDSFLLLEAELFMVSDAAPFSGSTVTHDMSARDTYLTEVAAGLMGAGASPCAL
jgi:hypothetical protein